MGLEFGKPIEFTAEEEESDAVEPVRKEELRGEKEKKRRHGEIKIFSLLKPKKENESGKKCRTSCKSIHSQSTSCHPVGSSRSDGNCMKISGLAIKHQSHFPF